MIAKIKRELAKYTTKKYEEISGTEQIILRRLCEFYGVEDGVRRWLAPNW